MTWSLHCTVSCEVLGFPCFVEFWRSSISCSACISNSVWLNVLFMCSGSVSHFQSIGTLIELCLCYCVSQSVKHALASTYPSVATSFLAFASARASSMVPICSSVLTSPSVSTFALALASGRFSARVSTNALVSLHCTVSCRLPWSLPIVGLQIPSE